MATELSLIDRYSLARTVFGIEFSGQTVKLFDSCFETNCNSLSYTFFSVDSNMIYRVTEILILLFDHVFK